MATRVLRRTATRVAIAAAIAFAAVLQGWLPGWSGSDTESAQPSSVTLPAEAVDTLALILRGGPFPYRKDGSAFHNRERLLPDRPRGYYRVYTVPTPGARDRGARRFVTGGDPPEVFYYTADHYRSFTPIDPAALPGARTVSPRDAGQPR